jgi:hypothetical protein
MANLILKPGSGGSLILQDEGGTPAISIDASGNSTLAAISNATVFPVGHVLQFKSTLVTDRPSSTDVDTSGTGTDCGLNVTITPISSTSDFLISLSIVQWGSLDSNSMGIILSKDGTKVGNGSDVSSRNGIFCGGVKFSWNDPNHCDGTAAHYLDTVSGTAARTYKCGLISQYTSAIAYINSNGSGTDNDQVYSSYTGSTLTVMEIQGA